MSWAILGFIALIWIASVVEQQQSKIDELDRELHPEKYKSNYDDSYL